MRQRRIDDALAQLRRAYLISPDTGVYLHLIGELLLLSGDHESALEAYQRAGQLDEYDRDWVRRWHLRSGLPSQMARVGWGAEIYEVDAQAR